MSVLTPLAVSHADVLRYLHGHLNPTPAEIAAATGRVTSNVKRDLGKLAEAGLVALEPLVIMPDGEAVLAALARAAGDVAAAEAPDGHALLLHIQIDPDPLNPRKHFDPRRSTSSPTPSPATACWRTWWCARRRARRAVPDRRRGKDGPPDAPPGRRRAPPPRHQAADRARRLAQDAPDPLQASSTSTTPATAAWPWSRTCSARTCARSTRPRP
jgi:hypothetical protein